MKGTVFIGFDPRERRAWNVCARSLAAGARIPPAIEPISLSSLGASYTRPTSRRTVDGYVRLWDDLSGAPMATEFALARFWVPLVARGQWALFCDADFLWRASVEDVFAQADPRFAVQVVKHEYCPTDTLKMDGQAQTAYPRKNWSSLVLWNLTHAGSRRLWPEDLNTKPGLWLHQFAWLRPEEIGELHPFWNVLEGTTLDYSARALAFHYTRGTPDMRAEPMPHDREWWSWLTPREITQYHAERTRQCAQADSVTG